MIPFASQRGHGQDLATHLLNEHDNEYMEVADLRGSVADDLHGAFKEWEIQAHSLTKCKNYLYSLSVNPDHRQGEFTREQYFEYLVRVEEKLGLTDQPRAVVFHIKNDREHCHAIYSRIDAENEKAVHMAFDKDKLMMVTRQFARDHGLTLPEGYHKSRGQHQGKEPLSLYEKHQQETTGLTKARHMDVVTDIWRQSDSAKAFIAALEQSGYVLCSGNRDYVLVDYYGHMNSLPKLIDDKQVRTKDIREFLGKDYPKEDLPDVDEARKLITQHRKVEEEFRQTQVQAEQLECLKTDQANRRKELEEKSKALTRKQEQEKQQLLDRQEVQRNALYTAYQQDKNQIQGQREAKKPTGLSALLAKVSGFNFLQHKIHQYQDQKRQAAYAERQRQLQLTQNEKRLELEQLQQATRLDMQRQLRALADVEKRELKSLDIQALKENRIHYRQGQLHMPSPALRLKPPGRKPMVYRAKQRLGSELSRAIHQNAETKNPPPDIRQGFHQTGAASNRDDSTHRDNEQMEQKTRTKNPRNTDRTNDGRDSRKR